MGNEKLFIEVLKSLWEETYYYTLGYINSSDSKILTQNEDMMTRWEEYYENMLAVEQINTEQENTEETDDDSEGIKSRRKTRRYNFRRSYKWNKDARKWKRGWICCNNIENDSKFGKECRWSPNPII